MSTNYSDDAAHVIPCVETVAAPLYSLRLVFKPLDGEIFCSNCRCACEQLPHIRTMHKHFSACDMHFFHSVCSGCVLSSDDDPLMVYPLTYTHLDVEATCLLLIKATLREYPGNSSIVVLISGCDVYKRHKDRDCYGHKYCQSCYNKVYDVC